MLMLMEKEKTQLAKSSTTKKNFQQIKEMTKEDDGKYSYTIERNWNSPLIIFNDGDYTDSVQYPEGKGLKVEADKTYSVKED